MVCLFSLPMITVLKLSGLGRKGPKRHKQIRTNMSLEHSWQEKTSSSLGAGLGGSCAGALRLPPAISTCQVETGVTQIEAPKITAFLRRQSTQEN